MIKISGNKELVGMYVGDRAISKIMNGDRLIWENWKKMSGQLYTMATNPWNGFVASASMDIFRGSPREAFDNNAGTFIQTNNCNLGSTVRIDFPKSVKLRKIRYIIGATHSDEQVGTTWLTYTIYGIKEDGSSVALHSNSSNNLYNSTPVEFAVTDDELYKGIYVVKTDRYGWGWYRVTELQVTEWAQKG